ncbi:DUF4363 family protein [Paucisalibacillus globulus]|uniref:DUF4363 family protein n=1 Tax=Paucisalibacillus globulus TaxID=351095 RepID=UPI0015970C0A|nr:DUF4363 family protein [Paucisalibacillus globulus]
MLKNTIFISLLILITFFIGGCTEPIGGDYFFNKVEALEVAISQEDWQNANMLLEDLKKLYKKNDWKLQLLGDEAEYEGMNEAISRLSAAIVSLDSKPALLELATIRAYLEEIYSM